MKTRLLGNTNMLKCAYQQDLFGAVNNFIPITGRNSLQSCFIYVVFRLLFNIFIFLKQTCLYSSGSPIQKTALSHPKHCASFWPRVKRERKGQGYCLKSPQGHLAKDMHSPPPTPTMRNILLEETVSLS